MLSTMNAHSRTLLLSLTGLCIAFALVASPGAKGESTRADVTFNRDVAPILFNHCASCHRPGQGAPFSLLNYQDAKRRAAVIATVTETRQMPPWKPGPSDCPLQDDIHLSDAQISTIQRWVKTGMAEGKPGDLPPLPKFTEGWTLGEPDLIVKMPEAFPVPSEGRDIYRNFALPLNLPGDTYIRAIDFRPSAKAVVHHSLFFFDASGETKKRNGEDGKPGFSGAMGGLTGGGGGGGALQRIRQGGGASSSFGSLGGWAVGAQPVFLPEGLAFPVPKGSDLILSTHFHPSGKAEQEQSVVGIYLAKRPPEKQFATIQFPPVFGALSGLNIPAGEKDYVIKDEFKLPVAVKAFGVAGHAHYLAKSMKLTATLPDGATKTLFSIPDWDFNWQGQYVYREFVSLPKDTVLRCEIHYDNSADNPHQPSHPPKAVRWGEQSTDEMGSVMLRLIASDDKDLPELQNAYRSHLRDQFRKRAFRPGRRRIGRNE